MFAAPWLSETQKRHGFDYPSPPMQPYEPESGCLMALQLTSWGDFDLQHIFGNTEVGTGDHAYDWWEEVGDEVQPHKIWGGDFLRDQFTIMLQNGLCPGDVALIWFHKPHWTVDYWGEGDVSYDWHVVATIREWTSTRARRWWTAWEAAKPGNHHTDKNAITRAHWARRGEWSIEYSWCGENVMRRDHLSVRFLSTITTQRYNRKSWNLPKRELATFSMKCEDEYDKRNLTVAIDALFESVKGRIKLTREEFGKLPVRCRHH